VLSFIQDILIVIKFNFFTLFIQFYNKYKSISKKFTASILFAHFQEINHNLHHSYKLCCPCWGLTIHRHRPTESLIIKVDLKLAPTCIQLPIITPNAFFSIMTFVMWKKNKFSMG